MKIKHVWAQFIGSALLLGLHPNNTVCEQTTAVITGELKQAKLN